MISKELLSEVLKIHAEELGVYGDKNNVDVVSQGVLIFTINTYELAHKCKEWAWNQNFTLESYFMEFDGKTMEARVNILKGKNSSLFLSDVYVDEPTEPEAIFQACEWILNQKENNEQ